MTTTHATSSAALRARLDHPIIDTDGHMLELMPVFLDYVREIGGHEIAERVAVEWESGRTWAGWKTMSRQERSDTRTPAAGWWGYAAHQTLDRASASLPRLLHRRMDDLGIDFAVLYPTQGLALLLQPDAELRRVACRALNTYYADQFRAYADRITPTAIIPIHTPEEAIAELEYVVGTLGLKAIAIMGQVQRPIPRVARERPDFAKYAGYLDFLAVDSDYDYDPFWAKCLELKVAVGAHGTGQGWGSRRSISSYMFNHIGAFAAAGEGFCRALVLGGAPRRFPTLKFAFLEGGVAWACQLYAGLIGHWEKRNGRAIQALDPAKLDRAELRRLFTEHAEGRVRERLDEIDAGFGRPDFRPEELDEFAATGVANAEEFRTIFERQLFFGCEADDPLNAWAFDTRINPFGARLRPILGSDIGHWDVADMTEVLTEAYELVERELISEADFRDFTFTNAVDLYAGVNPDFFKGTAVERYLK
jgi:predicted TIM-barrel fold metal-dependent hydrolase